MGGGEGITVKLTVKELYGEKRKTVFPVFLRKGLRFKWNEGESARYLTLENGRCHSLHPSNTLFSWCNSYEMTWCSEILIFRSMLEVSSLFCKRYIRFLCMYNTCGHVSWTGPLLRYMVKITNFRNFQYIKPYPILKIYCKQNSNIFHGLGDISVCRSGYNGKKH